MVQTGQIWRRFDYVLLGSTVLLIIFGVLMIASSTQNAIDPDLINRVPDQIRFAVAGVVVMVVLALVDYRLLGGMHIWLYLLMIVLLLLVRILGVEGDAGAQRWLNIGIRVQPSEVGKIVLIIALAQFLSSRYHEMDRFTTVLKSMMFVAIPALLVFIQPDLGTTIVFVVIWAVQVWGAGLRLKHIALLGLAGLIAMPFALSRLEPYQLSRITTFIALSSELDIETPELRDARYNIDQALISIGSGGVFGKGYGVGSQNRGRFLRVRHTDFIFSVIAHEFGLVGSVAVMGMIGVVILRILRAARLAADALGSLICYGVAAMIFFQTAVSIGMNLSLMPVTGLTLPFVSSGGTSLLFTLIGIGLVQSVVVRRRRVAAANPYTPM